ncbi:MAG: DUF502 domain-containing protein [Thermaceae bacterium]
MKGLRLGERFIAGLVALLPLLVSLYFLGWVYTSSGSLIQRVLLALGLEVSPGMRPLLPFFGLLLTLLLIYLIGLLTENYLGRRLINLLERPIIAFPILRDIHKAVQQIASTLFGRTEVKFARAALIEYPRQGVYTLCFVVQPVGDKLPPLPEGYVAVLVPTSPVPASGMVVLVPQEEVLPLEISVEEALRYVVSAGFLLPERDLKTLMPLPSSSQGKS